jgi:putative ABC transport system permease protein
MRRLMNIDYYGSILLQANSVRAMDGAAAIVVQILTQRHRTVASTGPDFQVQNQKALLDTQIAAFNRLTFFLKWIAASSLTVASLGIFGVAWIGVGQRDREIGTTRAVGATAGDVLIQFFAEGMAGPLVGCGVGVVVAWFALRTIDARVGQPFLFSKLSASGAAALSTTLYGLSMLLCCLRAIRVEPSVALRAE